MELVRDITKLEQAAIVPDFVHIYGECPLVGSYHDHAFVR